MTLRLQGRRGSRQHPHSPALPFLVLPLPPIPVQSVVLMSHLGRPDGMPNPKASMAPCLPILKVRGGARVASLSKVPAR
jgi:hypothetical protein